MEQFPIIPITLIYYIFCDRQQLEQRYSRWESWSRQNNTMIRSPCWMWMADLNDSGHKFKIYMLYVPIKYFHKPGFYAFSFPPTGKLVKAEEKTASKEHEPCFRLPKKGLRLKSLSEELRTWSFNFHISGKTHYTVLGEKMPFLPSFVLGNFFGSETELSKE